MSSELKRFLAILDQQNPGFFSSCSDFMQLQAGDNNLGKLCKVISDSFRISFEWDLIFTLK